jgi:hypothetical protein
VRLPPRGRDCLSLKRVFITRGDDGTWRKALFTIRGTAPFG